MPKYLHIEVEELRRLYVDRQLSTLVIAEKFGTTKATIRRKLNAAGIPRRTGAQAFRLSIDSGRRKVLKGEECPWRKGFRMCCGYRMVKDPHNRAKNGLSMEHRLIMEQHLGRLLEPWEQVHHKNEVRDDNRLENLELMTQSAHMSYHTKKRWDTGQMKKKGQWK